MKFNVGIEVNPTFSEPEIVLVPNRKIKWRFPWRINMLAVPRWSRGKYVYPDPNEPYHKKIPPELDPDVVFRSDHLARLPLRYTSVPMSESFSTKTKKNLSKAYKNTWESIYSFYYNQIRTKRLRRLRAIRLKRLEKQHKKSKQTKDQILKARSEYVLKLAKAKRVFLPKKIRRKHKDLNALLDGIDKLSEPVHRPITEPRVLPFKVSEGAKTYEITETLLKLVQPPEWRQKPQSILALHPGGVRPNALHAICSPRVLDLAKPSLSRREAKKQEEEKFDPWAISPATLKYKPSARILELAKPLERE